MYIKVFPSFVCAVPQRRSEVKWIRNAPQTQRANQAARGSRKKQRLRFKEVGSCGDKIPIFERCGLSPCQTSQQPYVSPQLPSGAGTLGTRAAKRGKQETLKGKRGKTATIPLCRAPPIVSRSAHPSPHMCNVKSPRAGSWKVALTPPLPAGDETISAGRWLRRRGSVGKRKELVQPAEAGCWNFFMTWESYSCNCQLHEYLHVSQNTVPKYQNSTPPNKQVILNHPRNAAVPDPQTIPYQAEVCIPGDEDPPSAHVQVPTHAHLSPHHQPPSVKHA